MYHYLHGIILEGQRSKIPSQITWPLPSGILSGACHFKALKCGVFLVRGQERKGTGADPPAGRYISQGWPDGGHLRLVIIGNCLVK